MREVLAQNVNRLMEERFRESGNRPLALAKASDQSLSTVQRVLSREVSATIDTIEALAKVLLPGLPVFQILVPWGLLGDLTSSSQNVRPLTGRTRTPLFSRSGRDQRTAVARRRRTG